MYPTAIELGHRCKRFRIVNEMSMKQLADMVHTTPQNIFRMEKNGISNVEMLGSVSKALGVDLLRDDVSFRNVSIDWILKSICDFYGLPLEELQRKYQHAYERGIVIYLLRKYRGASLVSIAREMGSYDCTTVLWRVKKVEEELEHNAVMKKEIDEIIDRILCA